jgi:HSP20 family protein
MADTAIQKRETQRGEAEQIRSGVTFIPAVDIIETDQELLLLADMPGVKPDGADIHYEAGVLTIYGRVEPRQNPDVNYLLQEYECGDFSRRFEIGEGIDAGKIEAELHDGVLRLHLPKTPQVMPRKISVKSA